MEDQILSYPIDHPTDMFLSVFTVNVAIKDVSKTPPTMAQCFPSIGDAKVR